MMDPRIKLMYWLYFTITSRAMFKSDGWVEDDEVRGEYCRVSRKFPIPCGGGGHQLKMMKYIVEELVNGYD